VNEISTKLVKTLTILLIISPIY